MSVHNETGVPEPGQAAYARVDYLVSGLPELQLVPGEKTIRTMIDKWAEAWSLRANESVVRAREEAAKQQQIAEAAVTAKQDAVDRARAVEDDARRALEKAIKHLKTGVDPDDQDEPVLGPPPFGSYADPSGRYRHTVGELMHIVALSLAVLADVAAFYQVIALAIGEQPWLLWFIVLAATALSLYLMHVSGEGVRAVVAHDRAARGAWIPTIAGVVWLLLGGGAFTLRLVVDDEAVGSPIFTFGLDLNIVAADGTDANVTNALLFLALYLVTGLVAFAGGYFTKNSLKQTCREKEAELKKASKALAAAEAALVEAKQTKANADATLAAAESKVNAHGKQFQVEADLLKEYASLRVQARAGGVGP